MTKRLQHNSAVEAKGQGGTEMLWRLIAAAFGALVVVSLLAPVDSVSVFFGTALPQNLGWLLLASLAAFASRRSEVQFRVSRMELIIVGCGLCWLVAVTLLASGHGNGRAVWNGFWHVMSLASCFYIGRALLKFSQVRATVLLLLLVGCTAMSFVGLEQVLISMPASRARFLENPERFLAEQGIDAPPGSPRRAQFQNRLNSPEPFANFALANSLASLLCLGVFLTSGSITSSLMRDAETQKHVLLKWGRLTGLTIALLVQLACLLLTRSRTAYLSVLMALGIWMILEWSRGRLRLSGRTLRIVGIVVGSLASIGFGWLLTVDSLVWSEAPKSISYRLEYWQATLAMIRDHAWTGVGLGNFQAYYPQYKLEQASEIIADPHNWILDVAASLSVPIAVLLIGWVGVTVAKGINACLIEGAKTQTSETVVESQRGGQLARALVGGAVVGGGLCSVILAMTDNLDLPTNLVAWGLSAALVWLAWRDGAHDISASSLVAAVVSAILCLLSSGSWQASGIAIPVLILLAIHWQWAAREKLPEPVAHLGAHSWLTPTIATLGVTIFVFQTWRPVTQSWMLAENAVTARSASEQLGLLELAAAADPLDVERELQRIQLLAATANAATESAVFTGTADRVMQELKRVSTPDVVGFLTPMLAGEISSQLAAAATRLGLPNQKYLEAAGGFYSQAVERYPSSVEMQIQFAAASALVDDWPNVSKSVDKATEISGRTPHLDKKLAAQLVFLPIKPAGFETQSDYVSAEPLADWLRTQSKAKLR